MKDIFDKKKSQRQNNLQDNDFNLPTSESLLILVKHLV